MGASLFVSSAPAQAGPGYKTTEGKSKPKYTESVVEEYRVDTKWGSIYGVVERPVVPKGVKVPVILTYTPYSIQQNPLAPVANLSYRDVPYFVPRGYARAAFDLVGTGASGGCYDYGGIRERETGAKVVDFLGTQNWSSGKVGMIGVSYDGTTQWAAAVERPKHLTTIVPQVGIDRWYDYAFSQGVRFYSGFGTPWLFDFGFGVVPSHPTVHDPIALADHVNPCERVAHNERAFLPDPVYDSFWDERDYLSRIKKVEASVMIEGSWVDSNVHPRNSINMWKALPHPHPKRLLMAQQGHGPANFVDSLNIRHAWFDYWLLGLDTGVMDLPAVDSLVNNNIRLQDRAWPPPGTKKKTFSLTAGKASPGAMGLTDAETPEWTDDDPNQSEFTAISGDGGTADLLFVGEPSKKRVRVSGIPLFKATVVSDRENTWLTPVLFDEDAAGDRQIITTGMMNARNRFGLRMSEPLVPGKAWKGTVEFQPADWVLEKGHRIGLAVMSMNSIEALYWSGHPTTNTLKLGGVSQLIVPLGPAK
jgi:X-Pro dipeptidyl-peptidase